MKNILLLGGYGFLGTNILKYLDECCGNAVRVIVFDKFAQHPADLLFDCVTKTYMGDFSDDVLTNRLFDDNPIDFVIHAISTTVPTSSFNARYDIESNLIPTINLINSMVQHGVKDIVYLSSGGAIYGNTSIVRHKEEENVFPISSYGVVKLAIEKYLMQYSELYGLRPLIVRLSNPYGPYHYSMKQGVCNVAMSSALSGNAFNVWGDGKAEKDYIYVCDFTEILFKLIDKKIHSQVINIGSGQIATVNDILERIKKLVPEFHWYYSDASRYDVSHFELDTSKLLSIIGDFHFTNLIDGLEKTYAWQLSALEAGQNPQSS